MRYAVKGKPDFHTISDEKLKSFQDLIQQMLFAYQKESPEKVKVLTEIRKDLVNEDLDRLSEAISKTVDEKYDEEVKPTLLKKVPKLVKSPAKRKI